MSLASKLTLGVSVFAAASIVYLVQIKQQEDIKRMHEGVLRDKERQQRRKIENTYYLDQQTEFARKMKKETADKADIKLLN